MSYLPIIGCALLGFGVVFLLTPLILKGTYRFAPSRRQDLHHTSRDTIPRFGGLALAAAYILVEVFIALFFPERRAQVVGRGVVVVGSLAMFALGFWDDIKPLGARKKLLGQVLIAAFVYYCGLGITHFKLPFLNTIIALNGWGVVVTVVWLVGMTNLVNLIDGVDGLAGGICLMLMALLVYVGHASGTFELTTSGMAGALLGFLWFNFPPARIYLGDGGAYFLGFQIGIYSIVSSQKGTIFAALIAPLFVLALPIVDTSLAILRRGLRGLPLFRPDRRHLHHHMLNMGLSRRRVVLSFYAITLLFLGMGFAAFFSRGQWVPILLGAAVLVLLVCAGKLSFSREWFAVGRTVGNSIAMRQEVQYALSLTRWLGLEGERCESVEQLWQFLLFAAQRLGFTSVRLTLADGHRVWQHPDYAEPSQLFAWEIQTGTCGSLELRAPTCSLDNPAASEAATRRFAACKRVHCPCVAESRLFDIVAELLAEGWLKAATRWKAGQNPVLRFDLRPSGLGNMAPLQGSSKLAAPAVQAHQPEPGMTGIAAD